MANLDARPSNIILLNGKCSTVIKVSKTRLVMDVFFLLNWIASLNSPQRELQENVSQKKRYKGTVIQFFFRNDEKKELHWMPVLFPQFLSIFFALAPQTDQIQHPIWTMFREKKRQNKKKRTHFPFLIGNSFTQRILKRWLHDFSLFFAGLPFLFNCSTVCPLL